MSLLDDARKIATTPPYGTDGMGNTECLYCGTWLRVGREDTHRPDCAWLAMPKILAALEAAERLASLMVDKLS